MDKSAPSGLKRTEHDEQCAVIDWANAYAGRYPDLRWLHAIPNGGQRNVVIALKLQAEGVKSGVPDLFLPCPKKGYHGLYIEMKVKPNKTRPEQDEWLDALSDYGYRVEVCYSADEAIAALKNYIWITS